MYDDYDLDYTYSNESYVYDLDEMLEYHMNQVSRDIQQESYDDDDDYARDSCDYSDLAYRHYAWYNKHTGHDEDLMYAQTHKRIVSVTLDIECYEDLDLCSINWNDVLGLEGDEHVDVSIEEAAEIYWCDTF